MADRAIFRAEYSGVNSEEAINDQKLSARREFNGILDDINQIIKENDPSRWWRLALRYLGWRVADIERNPNLYSEEVKIFFSENIESVFAILENYASVAEQKDLSFVESIGLSAQKAIHDVSKKFEIVEDGQSEEEPRTVSLETLLQDTDRFKLENTTARDRLLVRQDTESEWYALPLPNHEGIYYKGGAARLVLKLFARSRSDLLKPEFPLNDFDMLSLGEDEQYVQEEARLLGVDPAGIEHAELEDMSVVLAQRDLDLNACFLGREGLVYTPSALKAAETGNIHLLSRDKGVYGKEVVFYQNQKLAKNRGLYRLFKFLAEGKASSFELTPLNRQVDLGIFWLPLATKFLSKNNSKVLLERLYYVGKQTGQVREGEVNIFDVLNRVHSQYPFVGIDQRELNHVGLAQWLFKKLSRMVDRNFRRRFNIPSDFSLTRSEGDTEPYRISCDGFVESDIQKEEWSVMVSSFLAECEKRNTASGFPESRV